MGTPRLDPCHEPFAIRHTPYAMRHTPPPYDIAIVGAGPAGSATASLLAAEGFRVALLERTRFPRPKPCAEYLSPEASRVLARLGVLAELERLPHARLAGMRVVSPDGTAFVGRFAGRHVFRGFSDVGLALRREALDETLARGAVGRGAAFFEQTSVAGWCADDGGVVLALRTGTGTFTLRARALVGADGLNSRIASRMGVRRRGSRRRIALVTHAVGVKGMADVGEMHVGPAGYVGLAPVGGGVTNVAAVTDLSGATRSGAPAGWLDALLAHYPVVRDRLAGSRRVSPVRAVGPFARWVTRATADRVLLVGDAADFCDPFTGEGIYAALHGAELATDVLAPALTAGRLSASDLGPYDAARRRAFGGKWIVERLVSWAVAHPAVMNHVARRLAARAGLADLLVGVTGDFVPPSRVLRPSFAWRLVR